MTARKNRIELLDELRKKRDKLGRNPTLEDILSDSEMSNQSHYRREFGSLRKALEQLDKPTLNHGQIEEQTILKALVARADNLGRIPSRMEIDYISTVESYKKCEEIIGSYRLIVARIKQLRPGISSEYTKEVLLSDLTLLAEESGKSIDYTALIKDERIPIGNILKFYDDPEDALSAVGLKLIKRASLNLARQKEIIAGMQALAKKCGHKPVMREVDADPDLPSSTVVLKSLGCYTWSDVHRICGIDDLPSGKRTGHRYGKSLEEQRQEAIANFRQLAQKLGRLPTTKEIHIHLGLSATSKYFSLFGTSSIQNVAKLAGLDYEQNSD